MVDAIYQCIRLGAQAVGIISLSQVSKFTSCPWNPRPFSCIRSPNSTTYQLWFSPTSSSGISGGLEDYGILPHLYHFWRKAHPAGFSGPPIYSTNSFCSLCAYFCCLLHHSLSLPMDLWRFYFPLASHFVTLLFPL